jgi:ABC-type polysaccharide/polyol phosphate transport system ATPase subunit
MTAIVLDNVTLRYPIYDARARSFKLAMLGGVGGQVGGDQGRVEVQALTGVSLSLRDGDRLAVVGRNGAGKSTLLKVLAGIYEPPEGTVTIEGTVSAMTDVTMGMNMDATGRENVILRCLFLGMTYAEAQATLPDIEAFTELGPFLSLPIRTYSTGMLLRLGFAVSTAHRPEILIMDEVIGAGDTGFAEKAEARVKDYIAQARIFVVASHNSAILRQLCNKAVLLDGGRVREFGPLESVLAQYEHAAA